MTTPATPSDAQPVPPPGQPGSAPEQPKSRYSMGSGQNLVLSLLAVLGMMAALILVVPRVNSVGGPAVDVHATAVDVAQQSGWPIVEAVGLPDGWTETSARYVRTTDGFMTWHAGYQMPSGSYIAVEQTEDPSPAWVAAQVNRAPKVGTVEAAGRTWTTFVRDNKTQNSLLDDPQTGGDLTTLITGTASLAEMADFATYLQPVTP